MKCRNSQVMVKCPWQMVFVLMGETVMMKVIEHLDSTVHCEAERLQAHAESWAYYGKLPSICKGF